METISRKLRCRKQLVILDQRDGESRRDISKGKMWNLSLPTGFTVIRGTLAFRMKAWCYRSNRYVGN